MLLTSLVEAGDQRFAFILRTELAFVARTTTT